MRRVLFAMACSVAATACSGPLMPAAGRFPSPPLHAPGPFQAGVYRVDVTPPPGVSTFGHGPDARVAQGFWTRLYCRVFVLAVRGGETVAIVPCDLAGISTLLHRRVAEKVGDLVPPSRLVLTATHTHAGPAHYFEGVAYSGALSSRLPGHDDRMVEFLATRIAFGIHEAHRTMTPARMRWVRTQMWGLTRNRSLQAWRRNNPSPGPLFPGPIPPGLTEAQLAIDPLVRTLELEGAEGGDRHRPIGWLTFVAMHPTVLSHKSTLMGADAFGVASRAVEGHLRGVSAEAGYGYTDPLHGIINTNEGDIRVEVGDDDRTVERAIGVGRSLAGKVVEGSDRAGAGGWKEQIVLGSRYLEVDLPDHIVNGGKVRLAKSGELGGRAIRGATDHPTEAPYDVKLPATDPFRTGPQAPKEPAGWSLQSFIMGEGMFPRRVPLTLMRVGETAVSFLPAEVTVTTGARINAAVRRADPASHDAVIGGLANGYLQYVTTAEEYDEQAYEGASNLYGRHTATLLAEQFSLLARSLRGEDISRELPAGSPGPGEATAFEYSVGPERSRLPVGEGMEPMSAIRERRKVVGFCRIPGAAPAAVCLAWTDGGPGIAPMSQRPWIQVVDDETRRGVWGCGLEEGKCTRAITPMDDQGVDFQTRVHEESDGVYLWTTVFRPREAEWETIGGTRVRLRVNPGIESAGFSRRELPRECTAGEAERCLKTRNQ